MSLDVDGVLTDGSIWVGADSPLSAPRELRRFHALDGLAIRMMQRAGLVVAFLSGKRSAAIRLRARELDIEEVSLGSRKGKFSALRGMLARRGCTWDQTAHLGDDLTDLAVMERVALPAAVVGAVPEVRAGAAWVGTVPGGEGPCANSRRRCSSPGESGTGRLRSSGKEDGLQVERGIRADCARERASGADAPRGRVRPGLFARVSLLPFLVACGSDAPPTASEPLPEGVDTAVRGMRTFVTRDGVRRAVVEADTAEWREDNEIHLRRMTLTFFDPNGQESTEVTAEFGTFHQLTGDLEAERQVVVEDRVDRQRLETERLRYRNADGRLLGDTTFHFVDPIEGLTLDGTAFESDPALDSVVVLNQEGEMLPVAAFSEAVPLPAVPTGDPAGFADDPVAGEPVAGEPAAGEPPGDEAPADSAAAEIDPEALPAPDPAAAADSAAAPPDTTTARPDSVSVSPDTLEALPGNLSAPPDSAEALPDSLPVPPDSTEVLPDSLSTPPDTAAAARR